MNVKQNTGSTIEAVVSRMKSISSINSELNTNDKSPIRFIAVSATIPNIEDFAKWLSSDLTHKQMAIYYKYD